MIPPGKMAENDPMINPMRTEHCEMLYDYEPASPSLAHHIVELCFPPLLGEGREGLLPFGELFIEERNSWNTPYKFSGKELDEETGYNYHGSRYLDPGISIWLSVDPLADLFPGYSPYNYALNNPIRLIDPSGMGPIKTPEGEETNVGEGYQATSDGKYLHGEGLPTKVWNPDLDYGPGSGSSGKGGYEDYTGADIDFSSYGGSNTQVGGGNFPDKPGLIGATADAWGAANSGREVLERESIRQGRINRQIANNFSEPLEHSMKAIKTVGKFLGWTSAAVAGYEFIDNPSVGGFVKFGANTALAGLRTVNPFVGIAIGVSDASGFSDWLVYDRINNVIK